eukprot:tig00000430_g596.t1
MAAFSRTSLPQIKNEPFLHVHYAPGSGGSKGAARKCTRLIDHPPAEYRIVKQAIIGLTHIVTVDDDLRARGILKIMQLVQADPATYRSNPRRFAVRSLGWLTYFDESMVVPAVQLLVDKMSREHEPSQYVRKGVFCEFAKDWIKACRSRDFHIRQAGIRGLGFAVCNAGNVIN